MIFELLYIGDTGGIKNFYSELMNGGAAKQAN
jgi:hypothetical protein